MLCQECIFHLQDKLQKNNKIRCKQKLLQLEKKLDTLSMQMQTRPRRMNSQINQNQFEIRQLLKCWFWGLAAMRNNELISRQEGFHNFSFFSPGNCFSQVLLAELLI